MKTKLILISILLISNFAWGYLYFNKNTLQNYSNEQKSNSDVQIYSLEGIGENWSVKNYKIIITQEKILRGNAELIYMGNSENIKYSNYYDITFYEENHKKEKTVVYSNSSNSSNGTVSILENLTDVGSIEGPYTYDETLRTDENYDNSFVVISWKDNNGNMYIEEINLNIFDKFIIEDDKL